MGRGMPQYFRLYLKAASGGEMRVPGLLTWGASHPIRASSGQRGNFLR